MIAALLVAWFALGWLLVTEFSYLPGGRLTVWLYDRLAILYPRKTRARAYVDAATQERILLAPLRALCARRLAPRVLDLGCGSGRATLLLMTQSWFAGRIVAVDPSRAMLAQLEAARGALPASQRERITIVCARAEEALRGVERFDACLLLEVGEFLPRFRALVRAIGTRLEPGGLLLLTRPPFPYSLLFPFRAQRRASLRRLLARAGFAAPAFHRWRRRYAVVHVWRPDTRHSGPS
jgi:SAM-dependent methyltransferase